MTDNTQATRILNVEDSRYIAMVPGTVLRQRYRLDSEIGRGGMGVVYRATDLELMREVAVKVLPEAASSDARQRLIREARSVAALNHPHIISVHDVGEEQGLPFFVMELVQGPSLAKAPPADLSRIVEIACQICAALDHAHANSIVHRDLKPDNVLLSAAGQRGSVKLADLGLALPGYGARISRTGLILGTASYMAPEQALGQPVDGRTDLYALGALLYELTTGRLPFTGDDPLTVVSQHVHAHVVPPRVLRPDLPPALEAVILRLLEKSPAGRFATARETAAALRESLAARETAGDPDSGATVAILDALSRGRLVGRAAELAEARELWRRARESHGHAVLLSGEPGAGKTRLAREITIQAAVEGAVVLTGGCYEYEATTPYLPFVEAFRRWVREQKEDSGLRRVLGDAAAQIAKLAPEIEIRLGPFPERPELPPHEERLLFFDAVAQVFAQLARERSLLFYADDLHWADHSTLWLLGHLLRQLREERALIVGAYRDTELNRSHPLAKALVDWNRERLITRIALRRFDAAGTSAQLSALLGENVGADFGEAVHRETEGNPFFVEEVLKALIEQGSVRRESGRWKRSEIGELLIPQSVKEAIGNRLGRISRESNEVLRAAAVLGTTFTFDELMAAIGGRQEDALLDALDEAVGAQLITADAGDSFTFTHDKIREVLHEELNPVRRRRLHRLAAEGIERQRNDSGASRYPAEKLAYHYIQAGDYEHGLVYAKEAAAEAERVFAFDEAIAAYSHARDCAEALELIDEQLAQEKAIGKTYVLQGETIAAGEHFERALSLAQDPQLRAHLHSLAAASLVTTGDQRGLDHLREALSVLDPNVNPLGTANAIAIEGRFHHLAGRHQKAIDLLERAAGLVAPIAERDSVTPFAASIIPRIYGYLAGAYQHYGRFHDADHWAQRAVDFGVAHNVLFAQALGLEYLGENAIYSGDFVAGIQYAEREREIAATLHSRERRGWTHYIAALCAFYSGDPERAEREFLEGIAIAESIGELRLATLLKGNFAVLQVDQASEYRAGGIGDRYGAPPRTGSGVGRVDGQRLLDEALQTALDNFQAVETLGLHYSRFEGYRCLAEVRFRRGEFDETERLCAAASELVSGTESRLSRLWLGPLYIEVLLAAGLRAEAEGKPDEAAAKRGLAAEHLAHYQELVADCQSPRFRREAMRLADSVTLTLQPPSAHPTR
jgi:tetratricopeptide (TPR) repeat protein